MPIVEQVEQNATLAIAQEIKAAYDDFQLRGKTEKGTAYQQWIEWGKGIARRDGMVGYSETHLKRFKEIGESNFTPMRGRNLPDDFNPIYELTRALKKLTPATQEVIVGEVVEAQSAQEKTLTSTDVKEIVTATKRELEQQYSKQINELSN